MPGGRRLRAPRARGRAARRALRHGHGERRRTRRPAGAAGRPDPAAGRGGGPGPLTVYVAGQLQLDRRQRLPHLALARTTPSTVRYTALPWHWIREELRLRPSGATTLLLDLHADHETWQWLRTSPLDSGRNNAVYGRVAPPPARRAVAVPSYMRGVATILRSGHRPPPDELHQQALARAAADAPGSGAVTGADLVLTAPGPVAGDPHAVIAAAVRSGRHGDADAFAARHERAAAHAHGPASEDALHWAEVRADLAMFAGDPVRSCRSWLTVAEARLGAGQLRRRPPWRRPSTGPTTSGDGSATPDRPANWARPSPRCAAAYRAAARAPWTMSSAN